MERSGEADRRVLLVRPREGMRDRINDLAERFSVVEERKTYEKTKLTSTGPLRCRFKVDKAERKRENEHTIEGKTGPRLPAVQRGGRCVFIRRRRQGRTSTLRIVVSKEKGKRRECASPATLPCGDVIERNVQYSILRGKERCLKGRNCGRVVKASTVFVLGPLD